MVVSVFEFVAEDLAAPVVVEQSLLHFVVGEEARHIVVAGFGERDHLFAVDE